MRELFLGHEGVESLGELGREVEVGLRLESEGPDGIGDEVCERHRVA